jgi:hypothetical protein
MDGRRRWAERKTTDIKDTILLNGLLNPGVDPMTILSDDDRAQALKILRTRYETNKRPEEIPADIPNRTERGHHALLARIFSQGRSTRTNGRILSEFSATTSMLMCLPGGKRTARGFALSIASPVSHLRYLQCLLPPNDSCPKRND